jgi:hypothetical protein
MIVHNVLSDTQDGGSSQRRDHLKREITRNFEKMSEIGGGLFCQAALAEAGRQAGIG